MSGGADVGRAVVVGLEARPLPLVTLAPEDTDERQLELAVVAGVDDGVQAAVEVAQPEDDFEEDLRRAQVHIKRAWRAKSTTTTKKEKKRSFHLYFWTAESTVTKQPSGF